MDKSYKNVTEKELVEQVNLMCIESLPPELFEKWEDVKKHLEFIRGALNKPNG